jgi:hypothetical protein
LRQLTGGTWPLLRLLLRLLVLLVLLSLLLLLPLPLLLPARPLPVTPGLLPLDCCPVAVVASHLCEMRNLVNLLFLFFLKKGGEK